MKARLVDLEQKIVAAYNRPVELGWNNTISSYLRVNLGNQKLASTAYLLLFCLDVTSRNTVA